MYRCRKCHRAWDDRDTLRNKFHCFADCGGELEPVQDGAGEAQHLAPTSIAALPSFLAIPLTKFFVEDRPMTRLQRLCDAVEILVRFFTILGIAELRHALGAEPLPDKVLNEFKFRIERPTFGQWRDMLAAINSAMPTSSPVSPPETWRFVSEHLLPPLLDAPAELEGRNLLALRNLIIHGGIDSSAWAEGELAACDPWVQQLAPRLEFLQHFELCSVRDGVARRLTTAAIDASPAVPLPSALQGSLASLDRHVVLVTTAAVLDLWPLCDFGRGSSNSPAGRKESQHESPLIYLRCDRDRLLYAALGGDLPFAERFDERAAFLRLFRLETRTSPEAAAPSDFEAEIRRDASALVGRLDDLKQIKAAIKEAPQGLLWIGGPGGIGKSFLMAKLADDLGNDPQKLCRIAWRFKKSDQAHCNRLALFRHAVGSLARWKHLAQPELVPATSPDALQEQLTRLLDGAAQLQPIGKAKSPPRVLFVLDGLDEIAWSDPEFPAMLLQLQRPNVVWVCSGREDRPLFPEDLIQRVFEKGLPPMSAADIRGMLLEGSGSLKYDFLKLDQEVTAVTNDPTKSRVNNVAIEAIVARALGSPLYVRHVVDDLTSGHFTVEELPRRLPPSLEAYFRDLLNRLSIGQLQMLLTPLLVAICQAKAPIDAGTLHYLMSKRLLVHFDEAGLADVQGSLQQMRSLLKSVALPGNCDGYEPHHARFREHVLSEPDLARQHHITQKKLCRVVRQWRRAPRGHSARDYFFRCGIAHLRDGQRWRALAALVTDFEFIQGCLEAGGIYELIQTYRMLPPSVQSESLRAWSMFINREAHILANHPQLLLQQALNQPAGSLLTEEAQRRLNEQSPSAALLRRWDKGGQNDHPYLLRTFSGHLSAVTAVALSRDGKSVLSGGSDGTLKLWELATGRELAEFRGCAGKVRAIVSRPTGWLVVHEFTATSERLFGTLPEPPSLAVWSVKIDAQGHAAGQPAYSLPIGHYSTTEVAIAPDGLSAVYNLQHELVVWELDSGRELGRFTGHAEQISALTFSSDARCVISADCKANIKVWNARTLEQRASWTIAGSYFALGLTADDQQVYVIDGSGFESSLRAGGLQVSEASKFIMSWRAWSANGIWLSPDDRHLLIAGSDLVGNDPLLRLCERSSGKSVCEFRGHTDAIKAIDFTADGQVLLTGSNDGTVKAWDFGSGARREKAVGQPAAPSIFQAFKSFLGELGHEAAGHSEILRADALDGEGRIVVHRLHAGTWQLGLHELDGGPPARWRAMTEGPLPDGYNLLRSLAVSPGARLWAHGDFVGCIRVYKFPLANHVRPSLPTAVGQFFADNSTLVLTLKLHETREIKHLALASDRPCGVSAASHEKVLQVWELAPGLLAQGAIHKQLQQRSWTGALESNLFWRVREQRTLSGHEQSITGLAITSDGQRVVSASADKTIKVWSLSLGQELQTLVGHEAAVKALALSPDDRQIVSGGEDQTLRIWNFDGSLVKAWQAHRQSIVSVVVSPDGRYVLSSGSDRWLKVWEAASGKLVAEYPTPDTIVKVSVSAGGQIVARDGGGQLYVLGLLGATLQGRPKDR